MRRPKISRGQRVYQNQYHHIDKVTADFGDFAKEFYVSDYGRRVGLVIARGDDILLISQYRLLINAESWEIPGGKVDANETPKKAAAREALEEASMKCRNLKPLIYLHPGLDTFDNPTHIFYATEFTEAPAGSLHKEEVTGRAWIPLSRCVKMIFDGKIQDSLTIASLLAFHALKSRPNLRSRLS